MLLLFPMFGVGYYAWMRSTVHLPLLPSYASAMWWRTLDTRLGVCWTTAQAGPWVMFYTLEDFCVSEAIPDCWIRKGDNIPKNLNSLSKENAVIRRITEENVRLL